MGKEELSALEKFSDYIWCVMSHSFLKVLHWSYPPKRMLVEAPESCNVPFFLLMAFILSANHLLSCGFI